MKFVRTAKQYDSQPLWIWLRGLFVLSLLPALATAAEETIEEIIVVAPRTLVSIKRQMLRADIEMYKISNTLIDDPLYKVWCLLEPIPRSRIQRRVCKPGFERQVNADILADEVTMGRFSIGEPTFTNNYDLSRAEIGRHRKVLKQKFADLAADNPELANAIYERAHLNMEYEKTLQRNRQKDD
ncbi:MAG: hypothetical protein GXP15_16195 [Gammaproteobacteria bacterium]|nr:hypothetical protein [Gammaproteobacteria bacterium]